MGVCTQGGCKGQVRGYKGKNCETVNHCDPNPCRSGGTCFEEDTDSGFYCSCPEGFWGTKCQNAPAKVSNLVRAAKEADTAKETDAAKEANAAKENDAANENDAAKVSNTAKETNTAKEAHAAKETNAANV